MQVKVNPNDFWTEVEVADHKLPLHYVDTLKALYFNLEDWGNGLCSKDQIYKLKQEAQSPKPQNVPAVTGPKKTYAEKLQVLSEQAVDAVLDHPGGAKAWFKENPTAHVKVLVKLATPQVQAPDVNLSVEVSWLSKERLSYKGGGKVQEDQNVVDISPIIEDAKVLEALSPTPEGSWKPKEDRTELSVDAAIGALNRSIPKPLGS